MLTNNSSNINHWNKLISDEIASGNWEKAQEYGASLSTEAASDRSLLVSTVLESLVVSEMNNDFPSFWRRFRKLGLFLNPSMRLVHDLSECNLEDRSALGRTLLSSAENDDELFCCAIVILLRHLFESEGYKADWNRKYFEEHIAKLIGSGFGGRNVSRIAFLTNVAGYSLRSSAEWNAMLYDAVVAPSIRKALTSNCLTLAGLLDVCTAHSISQQPPTEEQAAKCYSRVRPYFDEAVVSERLRQPSNSGPSTQPLRIAFLANNLASTSPTKVIAELIIARHLMVRDGGTANWIAALVSLSTVSDGVAQFSRDYGVPTICLNEKYGLFEESNLLVRIENLREELARLDIDILIFSDVYDGFTSFLSRSRLAPIQLYWAMGHFYCPMGTQWDARIAIGFPGERFRTIRGMQWRAVELPVTDEHTGTALVHLKKQSLVIRKQLKGYEVVLATIGRPQKIDNDAFLDCLAVILKAKPRAVFLWFGTDELASVRKRMEARGISGRCLFQGFQDIAVYAHTIDVHLDSFPFPGGYTVCETMAASVPTIFMESDDSAQIGMLNHIHSLASGKSENPADVDQVRNIFSLEGKGKKLLFVAANPKEYVDYALSLLSDRKLRQASGRAHRKFMEVFEFDRGRQLHSFSRHLTEVVSMRRSQSNPST